MIRLGMSLYDYFGSPDFEAPPCNGISKPDFVLGFAGINLGARLTEEYELIKMMNPSGCQEDNRTVTAFDPAAWIKDNLR